MFKKEEVLISNKMLKANHNKFKKPITANCLRNEKIKGLKKDFTNGCYDSNFDYLFDCFEFVSH